MKEKKYLTHWIPNKNRFGRDGTKKPNKKLGQIILQPPVVPSSGHITRSNTLPWTVGKVLKGTFTSEMKEVLVSR